MNLVSSRSRYGLLLLLDLADRGGCGPCDLASIADRQGIPLSYLAKLALALKTAGILRSSRGSRGGYELAKSLESIDLLSVVEVLEGPRSLQGCSDGNATREHPGDCRTLPIWAGLDRAVADYLRGVTLADAAALQRAEYSI